MVEGEAEGRVVKMIINSDERITELQAFDDTKAGVKGLVDQALTNIPTLFHHPPEKFPIASNTEHTMVPVIDLEGVSKDQITRQEVVSRIREACETWGFFQVVNHGIPLSVLDDMKDGVRRFFEQDLEHSIGEIVLNANYLLGLPSLKTCQKYADHIGGLQILHNDKWINIQPLPGTLVVNIGDLLQLISNDIFKSVQHRVLANLRGPRISIASFFGYSVPPSSKLLDPIKELLSEDNPPKYKETKKAEYVACLIAKGVGNNPLQDFRI